MDKGNSECYVCLCNDSCDVTYKICTCNSTIHAKCFEKMILHIREPWRCPVCKCNFDKYCVTQKKMTKMGIFLFVLSSSWLAFKMLGKTAEKKCEPQGFLWFHVTNCKCFLMKTEVICHRVAFFEKIEKLLFAASVFFFVFCSLSEASLFHTVYHWPSRAKKS